MAEKQKYGLYEEFAFIQQRESHKSLFSITLEQINKVKWAYEYTVY